MFINSYAMAFDIACYHKTSQQGGKFDFGALVLKIGSGIALLAIVSNMCAH